jgi:hypothetical protein
MSALSIFALRLAVGMTACLLLLSPAVVSPRFYRVHLLTALALAGVASVFAQVGDGWLWFWTCSSVAMGLTLIGALAFSLERSPGGRSLIVGAALALAGALACVDAFHPAMARSPVTTALADFTSAAVLGTALSAMLMGHSYLIAPSMSLRPLLVLIAGLAISIAARMAVDAVGFWTAGHSIGSLDNEEKLFLLVRWGVGFLGVLGLTWMAWQTARIRSTQSATGILYVVVIFCFLGELTSQLLSA